MPNETIEKVLSTTLENIRDMIDVNTIVGDAITAPDGSVIIPVSKVSFGFVAGGGDYGKKSSDPNSAAKSSFAGGSGAGVSIQPVAFLVAGCQPIRLLPTNSKGPYDKLIELVPQMLSEVRAFLQNKVQNGDECSVICPECGCITDECKCVDFVIAKDKSPKKQLKATKRQIQYVEAEPEDDDE